MKTNLILRSSLLFFAVFLFVASASAHQRSTRAYSYTVYNGGAWFKIEYPRGWKVTPLAQSTTSTTGYDSVRFTSPDGSAEFYVFSPQWNGLPREIALNPRSEVLVSHRTDLASRGKTGNRYSPSSLTVNWYTVRAIDNSYLRSWVDSEDKASNVRHVFGVKYRNAGVYKKYRAEYAHFCKSLVQYAD